MLCSPCGFAIMVIVDREKLRAVALLKAKRVAGANAEVQANMVDAMSVKAFIVFLIPERMSE